MGVLNKTTKKNLDTFEHLEHRRRLKKNEAQKSIKKRQNALAFQIGELVLASWPSTSQLHPQRERAKKEAEFALLQALLLDIFADPHYNTCLSQIASGKEMI